MKYMHHTMCIKYQKGKGERGKGERKGRGEQGRGNGRMAVRAVGDEMGMEKYERGMKEERR